MDWMAEGRRRAQTRLQSLADSAPSLSVPIHDSADYARGWKFLGEFYSCIPDAAYPWNPPIVHAIREFCPDVMPLSIRTVWQSSRLDGEPHTMVLVRHGIARYIRDPIAPIHIFDCAMPSTPIPGGVRLRKPNYIELNWYDHDVRPWGYDLPGAYLPFDWELYSSLRTAYVDNLAPKELTDKLVAPAAARKKEAAQQAADHSAYVDRDIQAYASKKMETLSETEQEEAVMNSLPPPEPRPQILVP